MLYFASLRPQYLMFFSVMCNPSCLLQKPVYRGNWRGAGGEGVFRNFWASFIDKQYMAGSLVQYFTKQNRRSLPFYRFQGLARGASSGRQGRHSSSNCLYSNVTLMVLMLKEMSTHGTSRQLSVCGSGFVVFLTHIQSLPIQLFSDR